VSEIGVVSDEGGVVVDAYLRDQSIRKRCFVAIAQNIPAKFASTLPVAFFDIEERQCKYEFNELFFDSRAAQRFGENGRREHSLLIEKRFSRSLNVHSWLTSRPPP
jgi:hypothetical protein